MGRCLTAITRARKEYSYRALKQHVTDWVCVSVGHGGGGGLQPWGQFGLRGLRSFFHNDLQVIVAFTPANAQSPAARRRWEGGRGANVGLELCPERAAYRVASSTEQPARLLYKRKILPGSPWASSSPLEQGLKIQRTRHKSPRGAHSLLRAPEGFAVSGLGGSEGAWPLGQVSHGDQYEAGGVGPDTGPRQLVILSRVC